METPDTKDPRVVADERLAARRVRVNRIRKRVTAGAVALFIAAFGGLYVQLSSGHDPALASQSATSTPAVTTTSTPATSTTSGTTSKASATTSTPSAVTTGQS